MQTQRLYFESVCRVLGGRVRPCALKTGADELLIDLVELRVVPQQFVNGCRQRAHGTVTVDIRSDRVRSALEELARSRSAVVLERPGAGALEMRCCDLSPTRGDGGDAGGSINSSSSTMTLSWHAP